MFRRGRKSGWTFDTSGSFSGSAFVITAGTGHFKLKGPVGNQVNFSYKSLGVTRGVGNEIGFSGSAEFMNSEGWLFMADSFAGAELTVSDIEGYCIINDVTDSFYMDGYSRTAFILGIPTKSIPSEILKNQGALGIGAEIISQFHWTNLGFASALLDYTAAGDWLDNLLTTNARALLVMKGDTMSESPMIGVSASLGQVSATAFEPIPVPPFEPPITNENQLDIKTSSTGVKIKLPNNALFDFCRYDLKPVGVTALVAAAPQILGRSSWNILVEGHTDSVGGKAFNKALSQNRAETVATWFVQNVNVPRRQIMAIGRGMDKPVAANQHRDGSDNPAGRRLNRRVEITLYP